MRIQYKLQEGVKHAYLIIQQSLKTTFYLITLVTIFFYLDKKNQLKSYVIIYNYLSKAATLVTVEGIEPWYVSVSCLKSLNNDSPFLTASAKHFFNLPYSTAWRHNRSADCSLVSGKSNVSFVRRSVNSFNIEETSLVSFEKFSKA